MPLERKNREIRMFDIRTLPAVMTQSERATLFRYAQECNGDAIEIGSWLGGSTIIIAKALKNGKVFAIDPHKNGMEHNEWKIKDTFNEFTLNIRKAGIADNVIAIRKTSEKALEGWNHKAGLIFIDGSHKYEDVKFDLHNWRNFLTEGGFMLMHDYGTYGDVSRAVSEELVDKLRFVKCVNSMVIFINDGKTSLTGRIRLSSYKHWMSCRMAIRRILNKYHV